ncbi:hypothetical protein [Actinocrispum sp. NPDC049592]|uniref:hypothetical protein n=1 Tax=Actinocrispum sp. NPDC049592 TaxID=3154835 RepID=UPI00344280CB
MTTYASQAPLTGDAAEQYLTEARRLLGDITSGKWIQPGLSAGGGFAAAQSTTKPVDRLRAAGLGWLEPDFRPLQEAQDRMALRPGQIQAYADAWDKAAAKISEVARMLGGCAPTDTKTWCGVSGDSYRARAAGMAQALEAASTMATAKRTAAVMAGEVTADARRQVGEILNTLVQDLISYLTVARSAHGGITAEDMAEAKNRIAAVAPRVSELETKLSNSMGELSATQYNSGQANPALLKDSMIPYLGGIGYWYSVLAWYLRGEPITDVLVPNRFRTSPQSAPMQPLPTQQQQGKAPWPQRQNYPSGPGFGRDWHNAMKELERAYEGKYLVNGWQVTKIERTLGGTKRVDFMMVNAQRKEIQILDYYTGKSEPLSHLNKSWSYAKEPEIQALLKQGYTFREPITGFPGKLQ